MLRSLQRPGPHRPALLVLAVLCGTALTVGAYLRSLEGGRPTSGISGPSTACSEEAPESAPWRPPTFEPNEDVQVPAG